MKVRILVIGFFLFSGIVWGQERESASHHEIPASEIARLQLNQNGRLSPPADLQTSSACPMNVPVGQDAVQFSLEVSTTNPNGVSYQVPILYNSPTTGGMLEHYGLTTNVGTWNVAQGSAQTVLSLTALVTTAQPLQYAVALAGKSPGTAFYAIRTLLNGVTTRDENCTFSDSLTIEGMLTSTPDTTFGLEFFASQSCNPSGFADGEVFLGSAVVFTDSLGQAASIGSFDTTLAFRRFITATAPDGSTSEFSLCDASAVMVVERATGTSVPSAFSLYPNYPNPFNQVTVIRSTCHTAMLYN